mmetsp:Transcript_33576/g.77430  ORF Transcript_33576/g.77430 Transcript_33576/m.77430 type:complete len:97 (+) Transcript_33576:361-651(+)
MFHAPWGFPLLSSHCCFLFYRKRSASQTKKQDMRRVSRIEATTTKVGAMSTSIIINDNTDHIPIHDSLTETTPRPFHYTSTRKHQPSFLTASNPGE